MIKYIGSLFIVLACAACDQNRFYEVNNELPNRLWLADSSQNFIFDITDTTERYNILYNLRNTSSYPFRNIYIQYSLKDSLGQSLAGDLKNGDLFDAKTGKPFGDGLGDVFDHQFSLLENYAFPESGKYELTIDQYMRRDTLPEIVAVGVRIEKVLQ